LRNIRDIKYPVIKGIIRSIIVKIDVNDLEIKSNFINISVIKPIKPIKLPKRRIVHKLIIFANLLFVIFSDLKRIFSLSGIELSIA
jgi:hypothetical protein